MHKIERDDNEWIILTIAIGAFCKFPIKHFDYDANKGFILVADDATQAFLLEDTLIRVLKAKTMADWRSQKIHIGNFEAVVARYSKLEKMAVLQEFLLQKDFLPILIVGGIIPEGLGEYAYVFRFKGDAEQILQSEKLAASLQKEIKENLSEILNKLKALKTSKWNLWFRYPNCKYFIALGTIIAICLRLENDEIYVDHWLRWYLLTGRKFINEQERLQELYNVQQAVKACVVRAVNKEEILFCSLDCMDKESEKKQVFFDENFYYFPEKDLKEICKPLTDTVSFLQLKREMLDCGMLVCDNAKNNFTLKVELYDQASNQKRRFRFLKICKDLLIEPGDIPLEDIVKIKEEDL